MTEQNPESRAREVVGAVGEIIKIAKDSPDARAAGEYAAKSLNIIAQTVHTVLLPLAAANYGAQRFANYMTTRFGPELEAKTKDIPAEDIVAPRPTIAGPVLDALVYAHEDDELRSRYVQLLATAMDGKTARGAHPAFVEILKQLTPEELEPLRIVMRNGRPHTPIAEYRKRTDQGNGFNVLMRHVIPWTDGENRHVRREYTAVYVENWIRLGLIEVDYDAWLVDEKRYEWMTVRPEYEELVTTVGAVQPQRGLLRVTDWGRAFSDAVRMDEEFVLEAEVDADADAED